MAELKPAYLIHGDHHGAVAERRAGLRTLAEGEQGGSVSVEVLEGDGATPEGVAAALAAMTLTVAGPAHVIIVEGAERWREARGDQAASRSGSREHAPRRCSPCSPARRRAPGFQRRCTSS